MQVLIHDWEFREWLVLGDVESLDFVCGVTEVQVAFDLLGQVFTAAILQSLLQCFDQVYAFL